MTGNDLGGSRLTHKASRGVGICFILLLSVGFIRFCLGTVCYGLKQAYFALIREHPGYTWQRKGRASVYLHFLHILSQISIIKYTPMIEVAIIINLPHYNYLVALTQGNPQTSP